MAVSKRLLWLWLLVPVQAVLSQPTPTGVKSPTYLSLSGGVSIPSGSFAGSRKSNPQSGYATPGMGWGISAAWGRTSFFAFSFSCQFAYNGVNDKEFRPQIKLSDPDEYFSGWMLAGIQLTRPLTPEMTGLAKLQAGLMVNRTPGLKYGTPYEYDIASGRLYTSPGWSAGAGVLLYNLVSLDLNFLAGYPNKYSFFRNDLGEAGIAPVSILQLNAGFILTPETLGSFVQ